MPLELECVHIEWKQHETTSLGLKIWPQAQAIARRAYGER
jgi:hypothetical protein